MAVVGARVVGHVAHAVTGIALGPGVPGSRGSRSRCGTSRSVPAPSRRCGRSAGRAALAQGVPTGSAWAGARWIRGAGRTRRPQTGDLRESRLPGGAHGDGHAGRVDPGPGEPASRVRVERRAGDDPRDELELRRGRGRLHRPAELRMDLLGGRIGGRAHLWRRAGRLRRLDPGCGEDRDEQGCRSQGDREPGATTPGRHDRFLRIHAAPTANLVGAPHPPTRGADGAPIAHRCPEGGHASAASAASRRTSAAGLRRPGRGAGPAPSGAPPATGARSRASRPPTTGPASGRRAAPGPARTAGRTRTRRRRGGRVAIRPRHVPRRVSTRSPPRGPASPGSASASTHT